MNFQLFLRFPLLKKGALIKIYTVYFKGSKNFCTKSTGKRFTFLKKGSLFFKVKMGTQYYNGFLSDGTLCNELLYAIY